jgi:hypothetical protein
MAIACPVDLDTQVLRSEVSRVYSRVAAESGSDFHFHRGPCYAAEFLGYDAAELATLPSDAPLPSPALAIRTPSLRFDLGTQFWISVAAQALICC